MPVVGSAPNRLSENCHPELVSGSLLVVTCCKKEIPKLVRNDRIRIICILGQPANMRQIQRNK
jgi:hypothetical protein